MKSTTDHNAHHSEARPHQAGSRANQRGGDRGGGADQASVLGLEGAVRRQLHQNGQRMTRLKQSVLEALTNGEVLSVEQIACQIAHLNDLSPLYRCLAGLEEAGVLTQVSVGDGPRRYGLHERFGRHHDYLLCTRCSSLEEISGCVLKESAQQHASRTGFLIEDHQVLLRGICADCRQVEDSAVRT